MEHSKKVVSVSFMAERNCCPGTWLPIFSSPRTLLIPSPKCPLKKWWTLSGASAANSPGSELPIHGVNGKRLGIEVFANPLPHLLISLIVRVPEDFQEVVITRNAPTVFRRTRLLPIQADRILSIVASEKALFQNDTVLPAIAEIIRVGQ